MKISTLKIAGFRCFPEKEELIDFDDLTCLVGPNASGKTATMFALVRMFGESQSERTIKASDFHLHSGETLASKTDRHLSLEVKIAFPELETEHHECGVIPEFFNQMVVDGCGETPYCRVRLEAEWLNDGTPTGEIHQKIWWILTTSDDLDIIKENRRPMSPSERAHIRVIYVPATRDPSAQIRSTTATAFGRLLRAIEWNGKDLSLRERLLELKTELSQLNGIETMNRKVQEAWGKLYDGRVAANVSFEAVEPDPIALLNLLAPAFAPNEQGQQMGSNELSDGLRSLFALSLPLGLYRVEELLKAEAVSSGFCSSVVDELPTLTFFAVEEPENHLSPHYLGKVVVELRNISKDSNSQVILSSHSPSIMRRIEPVEVRYFLGGETRAATEIRKLALPDNISDEAFKYVREAVRGYPELYFSRLVVLGEGPSEEIVLRRILEESGTPLDAHFVSIVPLGGRHVNHFWRLLNGLGIPYITLLDLDREKEGAGWGRIQYVRDQLIALHGKTSKLLDYASNGGENGSLANPIWDSLSLKNNVTDIEDMEKWLKYFRDQFDVYFSVPLDLDLSMLECFTAAYKGQAPSGGGPRLPKKPEELAIASRERMIQVLSADAASALPELGSSYSQAQIELFPWYKYLFIDGSKPVAHMRALVALSGTNWIASIPETLKALIEHVRSTVRPESPLVK